MNIVDSSGWLDYFSNGSNADFFAPVIENFEGLPQVKYIAKPKDKK